MYTTAHQVDYLQICIKICSQRIYFILFEHLFFPLPSNNEKVPVALRLNAHNTPYLPYMYSSHTNSNRLLQNDYWSISTY